jgi:hypothetical protein
VEPVHPHDPHRVADRVGDVLGERRLPAAGRTHEPQHEPAVAGSVTARNRDGLRDRELLG